MRRQMCLAGPNWTCCRPSWFRLCPSTNVLWPAEGVPIANQQQLLSGPDGQARWLLVSELPLKDARGRVTRLVGIYRDITEQIQMDAALQAERATLAQRVEERTADLIAANAELARAARYKDEFLVNMNHELRTPLNAILVLAESLLEEYGGPLTARQRKSVVTITESGQSLLALITGILDLARIGAGRLELIVDQVDVAELCMSSIEAFQAQADAKQLQISADLDSRVTHIVADPRRLRQILGNLLSNAIKFTPPAGAVGLSVVGAAAEGIARFTVWDTGIGIPAPDQQHIFEGFVQLDARLSRRYEGAGLGLVLAARLAELHGGKITVESAVGVGSRFTLTLPWHPEPAA